MVLSIQIKKYHNFERNEDRATVALKWTDISRCRNSVRASDIDIYLWFYNLFWILIENLSNQSEQTTNVIKKIRIRENIWWTHYRTRGYAFVEYLTHRHAALARRKLVPGRNFLFDQEIERVDWAEPEHEVDPDIMARVKVLFIRNLTMDTTQDEILATFEAVSDGQVDRVKKAKGQLMSTGHFLCLLI